VETKTKLDFNPANSDNATNKVETSLQSPNFVVIVLEGF